MDSKVEVFKNAIRNFLGPVIEFLEDPTVTEILINGPKEIFIERGGKLIKTDAEFVNEDDLLSAVNSIAQSVGRRISPKEPTLDARLPDGSRIHVVVPPVARSGTTVSIRKFTQTKMTLKDCVEKGTITADAAQFLDLCMYLGKNILVSGGTGSGKTTLLSVLASRIPKAQRVIVIEDSSELQIEYEHLVFFETQMADAQGVGEVDMKDLVKSSLRLRPDRIIVGEVRSSEALDLINAMNTGHKGCLGTIHANTPEDAMVRLEGLAMGGDSKISERALQHLIGAAVDVIVQISRFPDGSRRVKNISEVLGHDGKAYQVDHIFDLGQLKKSADGRLVGQLQPVGHIPSFMDEIEANKIPFTRAKFNKAA
ncbi:MAG: CpaF family protein [Bdellovibrionota bacterium]